MQWQKICYALYPEFEKMITICSCKKMHRPVLGTTQAIIQ